MAIHLATKESKKIQQAYVKGSLLQGHLTQADEFLGFRTVRIHSIDTVPMNDYTRSGSNRYGTPTEVQDSVQELEMTQDKGFSLTIDKGNASDQNGIKAAGRVLALQLKERAIPLKDQYGFARLAALAGKIVGNATALSKSNICDRISDGTVYMDEHEIPETGRTLFITPSGYKLLRLSDEFVGNEQLGKAALSKGHVGEYDSMNVVKVPSSRFPDNVNFMIVHKSAACSPSKIDDTKIHKDPPGLSGNLLEGRQYYDTFVFGKKADGIYVEVNTASGKGTILATPTVTATTGVIASTDSGMTIHYTTDGTDPRYSKTALTGTTPTVAVGDTVKAYATKDKCFASAVVTCEITAS